jgi:hypothetical protein
LRNPDLLHRSIAALERGHSIKQPNFSLPHLMADDEYALLS